MFVAVVLAAVLSTVVVCQCKGACFQRSSEFATTPLVPTRVVFDEVRAINITQVLNRVSVNDLEYPPPDEASVEEFVLQWLIEDDTARLDASSEEDLIQRYALAAIFFRSPFLNTTGHECTWEGISCTNNVQSRVSLSRQRSTWKWRGTFWNHSTTYSFHTRTFYPPR